MVTIFTTAKPFTGHSKVIQRNALKSWTLLHPDIEIILFGDEEGTAEVCAEFGLRHEPNVKRNEIGLKRIDCFFDRAQEIARHALVCYVNCDIILTVDLCRAIKQVSASFKNFLIVGRRWDVDVPDPIDFTVSVWADQIWEKAKLENQQREACWIDYFVFPKGLYYKKVPAFVIGRVGWDNWLVAQAPRLGAKVVDASAAAHAVHQNHDYTYHPEGKTGVWNDEYAARNLRIAGGEKRLKTIDDASRVFRDGKIRHNHHRHWIRLRAVVFKGLTKARAHLVSDFAIYKVWLPSWHAFLDVTRSFRKATGLTSASIKSSDSKRNARRGSP